MSTNSVNLLEQSKHRNQRTSETHSTAAVPMHSLYISATKSYVSIHVLLRCVSPPCQHIALCCPDRAESCVLLWRGFLDPENVSIWTQTPSVHGMCQSRKCVTNSDLRPLFRQPGRLHHINDGAKCTMEEVRGGGFYSFFSGI